MLLFTRSPWVLVLLAVLGTALPAQGQRYLAAPRAGASLLPGSVCIARVVDARFQRLGAGQFITTGPLLPMPATFEEGLASTLESFFAHYAPGQPGATPLLLRVTGLSVAAPRGLMARAGLVADLYAPQPDSSYRQVLHLALGNEQLAEFGMFRAPHATNLGALLLNVAAASRAQDTWLPGGPVVPAAYVRAVEPHPAEQLPVLAAEEPPQAGFYHSLPEFWANAPSELGPPDFDARPYSGVDWVGESEIKAYRFGPDGRRVPANDVWGFCDGRDFYLRQGNEFYRLRREGMGFVFRGRVGEGPAMHTTRTALNVLMLASVATGGPGVFTTGVAERPAMMNLDLLTGVSTLTATTGGTDFRARPTQLYLYRPPAAKGPPVRVRLAADEPAQELAAGDYLSFTLPASQAVQVCLLRADGSETCLPVGLAPEATTYLECQPDQPTPFQPVPAKTGETALRRLLR